MTVRADDGPSVTVGWEAPLGSATATVGITGVAAGYISGTGSNPDAGPNVSYAGVALKDPLYRYREGGGELVTGGYPNQALGFMSNLQFTADVIPSTISTVNIAAAQAPAAGIPLTLVSGAGGLGITAVATGGFTVLNSGLVVPAGTLQIDAAPAWYGFSTSGAIQGWSGAAVGRAVSLTSVSNLSGINFTIRGYDLYGFPQSEILVGPNDATVNSAKTYKWMASITPSGTNAGTVSVGTADIYGLPIRADHFANTIIWWNNTIITASTGFTAADATNPATQATGDPRGKYAIQGAASNGVIALQIVQRVGPGNLNTNPPRNGIFGILPA